MWRLDLKAALEGSLGFGVSSELRGMAAQHVFKLLGFFISAAVSALSYSLTKPLSERATEDTLCVLASLSTSTC